MKPPEITPERQEWLNSLEVGDEVEVCNGEYKHTHKITNIPPAKIMFGTGYIAREGVNPQGTRWIRPLKAKPQLLPDDTLEILKNTIETLIESIPTQRDRFIAAALNGLIANPTLLNVDENMGEESIRLLLSEKAIRIADQTIELLIREQLH